MKTYKKLASLINSVKNLETAQRYNKYPPSDSLSKVQAEWLERHRDEADYIAKNFLPSGAGFDNGTQIDWDASTGEKLVFATAFHHMDNNGFYKGWTKHKVILTPSFVHEFSMKVTGPNTNQIKEYIAESFGCALHTELPTQTGQAEAAPV